MTVYDWRLEFAQALRNRLFDLPGNVLDQLAERVFELGWVPRVDVGDVRGRRLTDTVACRRTVHGRCVSPLCRREIHNGYEYVPVQGWLPATQAQRERRAYLDMDKAIERSYDDVGDV